jgi:very-short-patch-repair endonuclease
MGGFKFYRQYPIPPYYVDFACRDIDLVIELDGGQHCGNRNDERRTRFLEAQGYTVLRFWNNEVMANMEGVMMRIQETLQAFTPALSLKGEGEEKMERGIE